MAKSCLRACGRLSTAATLIGVGVIQINAGLIFLKSEYVYLLSVPNFWTAFANIAVGCLLGISAATWKTINRKSSKYATRRGLLAALASSVMLLNITTAAMLIMDEGKNLLSIHLSNRIHSSMITEKEILAYAYATSVCSPIICVVISSTFLVGICLHRKTRSRKSVHIKDILNEDSTQVYSWVYTPKLPKPDPEILRAALSSSSDSGTSSSESDSDSSDEIPIRLRYHVSPDVYNSSMHEISCRSILQNSAARKDSILNSTHAKSGRVSFEEESSLEKSVPRKHGEAFRDRSFSSNEVERAEISLNAYQNEENVLPNRSVRSHGMPKILFTELPSGGAIDNIIDPSSFAMQYYNQNEEDFDYRLQLTENMHSINDEIIQALNSSRRSQNESAAYEDTAPPSPDTLLNISNHSLVHHGKVRRTSTADNSKVQQELKCLDDSAIYLDSTLAAQNSCDESLSPRMVSMQDHSLTNSVLNRSAQVMSKTRSAREELSTSVRDSNFRKRLPSKLIPVSTPVISDGKRYIVPSKRISASPGRVKPYSKTRNSYNKYLQTGFSSFKTGRRKANELDSMAKKHNSVKVTSPMTSISEMPVEEMHDSSLPSTSTHTSGYMSASYDESDDDSDTIHSSHPSKSHSLMIEKSEWADVPLDNECRSASFHSENFSQPWDRNSATETAKITPLRSGKVAKKFKISVI